MNALKFLITIFFWLALVAAIIILIHYRDYHEFYEALLANPGRYWEAVEGLKSYFTYMDGWNRVYSAIIASMLLAMFPINHQWVRARFEKFFLRLHNYSYLTAALGWLIMKAAALALVAIEFALISNIVIALSAEPQLRRKTAEIEPKEYALLLGANKTLHNKSAINLYYLYRIEAAAELYKSGKVRKIILSGDNNNASYNEPLDMKRDLMKRGVPEQDLLLDYAGFRTLDSVVRLKYHFGVDDVIIISQKFHLQRALFLAWFYDIKAAGFIAKGSMTSSMWQREALAKPKTVLDIFVFNMQPKYGKAAPRQPLRLMTPENKTLVISVILLLAITSWFFIQSLKFGGVEKKRKRKGLKTQRTSIW